MRPISLLTRTAIAATTASAILAAGATSAQAATTSPFDLLSKVTAGTQLNLGDAFSIKPGKVSTASNGTVTMKDATVLVGGVAGTGVTAKATPTGIALSGGTYVAPTSITDNTLKASTSSPISVALSNTGVTGIVGQLVSTTVGATTKQLTQTLGTDLVIPVDAVPAPPTSQPWAFNLGLDLQGVTVKGTAGPATLTGRVNWDTGYSFNASLNGLNWNGGVVTASGSISGSSIFSPNRTFALKGAINGNVALAPRLALRSGSAEWTASGIKVAGTVRLTCTSGYLDASATGLVRDVKNFTVHADGLASDCTFGQVASFDERTFDADVVSKNGAITFGAGFSGAKIDLYSRFLTSDAELSTTLEDISGRITNDCSTCDDGALRLSFKGTGVGQIRDWQRTAAASADPVKKATEISKLAVADRQIVKTSFSVRGTLNGQFDVKGSDVSKVSLSLDGVKLGPLDWVPGAILGHILKEDTIRGFSA